MKDFTHMNENKKYIGDGLINFSKIRNMHKLVSRYLEMFIDYLLPVISVYYKTDVGIFLWR